jgi:tetratricopeptide (TPR) repeat protein
MEFFRTAREHYREGRYREAAADLERALALDPVSPTLRYNLGRVEELLGNLEPALRAYRGYLELLPADALEERARTEATIQRLEGAIASGAGASQPAEAEPLRVPIGALQIRERGVADELFWGVTGSGLAMLAAAVVTGSLGLERAAQRDGLVLTEPGAFEAYRAEYDSLDGEARALALTTDVLFGVGGAAVAAGIVLFVARERVSEQPLIDRASGAALRVAPSLSVSDRGALLALRGAF